MPPSQAAAFLIREPPPNKVISRWGLGVCILMLLGHENSKTVRKTVPTSQIAAFLIRKTPQKMIPKAGLGASISKLLGR